MSLVRYGLTVLTMMVMVILMSMMRLVTNGLTDLGVTSAPMTIRMAVLESIRLMKTAILFLTPMGTINTMITGALIMLTMTGTG